MYEKQKYGITFSIDSRVELIFGMLSKLKKENSKLKEELDYIECFDNDYYSEYANKMYELIKFNKYPKLLQWTVKLSQVSSCDIVPNITLVISENFQTKENVEKNEYFNKFFNSIEEYKQFISDINEFVDQEDYLKFYKSNFDEYNRMINESTVIYPSNMNIKDIEDYYNSQLNKYPVIYSIFFNGGFGPIVDKIPTCFKGLWLDEKGKYIESTTGVLNLFHEYSHPFINLLVDKYWDRFENIDKFINYSIQNNLHKTYQNKPQTLYYEYYVRAMAYIMTSKYIDCSKELEKYNKLGFVESDKIINFISNNYEIGTVFEDFFANELIPFTNKLSDDLKYRNQKIILT